MQPLGGLVACRSDQTGEHARARQQDLRVDQASGREVKQHTRALCGRPRARVKPDPEFSLRAALGEVAVAVDTLDLPGVLAMGLLAPRVAREIARVDGELPGDRLRDDRRDVRRMGEERAEKPDRRELDREPEPVVIAAAISDPGAVNVVEVKEPLQLARRRRLAITAVAGDLRRAEKVDRHSASQVPLPRAQRRRRSRSCAAVSAATASALGRA